MGELQVLLKRLRGNEPLRDAAKRAGISHAYLAQLENGVDPRTGKDIRPSPETLKGIAKAYGYSYEQLMVSAGYLPEKQSGPSPAPVIDHPGIADLLLRVPDLTEEEKESLAEHWEWAMKQIIKERERRRRAPEKK